jgi:hypothetical protein
MANPKSVGTNILSGHGLGQEALCSQLGSAPFRIDGGPWHSPAMESAGMRAPALLQPSFHSKGNAFCLLCGLLLTWITGLLRVRQPKPMPPAGHV